MGKVLAPSSKPAVVAVLEKRFDGYKQARKQVETEWVLDFDAFMSKFSKDTGRDSDGEGWRSRVFFPMTKSKINVATSQVSDIWFQGGTFPFALKNTPEPDSPNEQLKELGFDLEERRRNMQKLIADQLIESKIKDELLEMLNSTALYGTGVLRAPFVTTRKRNRYKAKLKNKDLELPPIPPPDPDDPASVAEAEAAAKEAQELYIKNTEFALTEFEEAVPTARAVDPWDFFADPESNGDTQEMEGMFLRQLLMPHELDALKYINNVDGKPVYNTKAINDILREEQSTDELDDSSGPHRHRTSEETTTRGIYVFEYAGVLTKRDLAGQLNIPEEVNDIDPVEVIVTYSRGRLLRIVKNPFPGRMRPYHMVQWERIPGTPYGRGVARNLRHPQAFVNGMLRAYVDNKNLAANLMFAIRAESLEDGSSGDLRLRPGKNWRFADGTNVNEAFQSITVPDITGGIMEALERAEGWGDVASGIPRVLEGEQVTGPRETAFEVNERVKSAAKQLGLVMKYFDERIISPLMSAFYRWNMQFSERKDIQGDFEVVATGFSTFQNQTLRGITLKNFVQMLLNFPEQAERWNIDKMFDEIARTDNLDPDTYKYSDEEFEEIQAQKQEQQQMLMEQQQAMVEAEAAENEAEREHESEENQRDREAKLTQTLIQSEDKEKDRANRPSPQPGLPGPKRAGK